MKKEMMMVSLAMLGFVASAATIKSGESVAFLGDSITAQGWGLKSGYVRMCEAAFKANGLDIAIVPAGKSGHRSNDMLARLEKDVLSKKPTYMTLSCGVNDVWHGKNGVTLPDYKKNITAIVDKAQAAGIQVIILTATLIGEDVKNAGNVKLGTYNDFLRALAKEKGCSLVDLGAEAQRMVTEFRSKVKPGAYGRMPTFITVDGVHMNFLGNQMMATKILTDAFGFTSSELAKSTKVFEGLEIAYMFGIRPSGNTGKIKLTGEEYMRLDAVARKQNLTVDQLLKEKLVKETWLPLAEKTAHEAIQK